MLYTWRTSELGLLSMLTVYLVAGSTISLFVDGNQTVHSNSTPPTQEITSLSVQVDEKVVLSCPPFPLTMDFMITWKITLRDQTYCTRAYRRDRNETADTNCTDMGVTWASRPDQNPALLIDPVTIMHEGTYSCEMVTPKGNFQHDYHLHVSVPLEVSIFQNDTGTVLCKAVSGKPAAWISWTPEGKCVIEQENQRNGTVFVQSACYWEEDNVTTVTCSVFHWTGNKSLSLELHSGERRLEIHTSLCITLLICAVFIILIICFLKTIGSRKCKLTKTETIRDIEEDEMQPYASYTVKSNPLYDTTNKVKTNASCSDGSPYLTSYQYLGPVQINQETV